MSRVGDDSEIPSLESVIGLELIRMVILKSSDRKEEMSESIFNG